MRKLILFTLLVAWPSAALSQQIYGRLEGAANDAQGLVLPGVTVTLESAELVAPRSATTDVDGSYRFAQLVAGSYNMTFELGGFQTVVFEDITVVGGSTFEINATMDIATVAETVTVTGESPVVDVKTTGVSASFDTTQLEDVPSATDMWAVLQQSPGVRMRGYDVGGSHKSQQSGYETFGVRGQNRIINDGVNTTEGTGGAGGYYDFYAIGEFQVSAQGADVESNTPGATVNAVWKSGGNDFSGTEHFAYEPPDMIADNITSDLTSRGGTTAPVIEFYEAHIDLGGPIIRDKAWFYGAYNRFVIDRIISGQPEDQGTDLGDFDMFTVKANWQITDRDQFITFHHWSLKQKPFRGLSANRPAESILAQDSWSWLHKAEWQRVWSDRLYSNIQVNHFGFGWPMTPAVDPATAPPRFDSGTSFWSGAGWRPFTFNRWKPHSTGQFNYYLPTESGSHDLKFGWDMQIDERQFGWNANSGAVRYLDNSSQDPPRPHNVNEIHFQSFPNLNYDRNTHIDAYFQDVWTLSDRLTVNAGVRFGSQRIGYLGSNNVPGGACDATLGCLREIADVDANVAAALPLLFGSGAQVPAESNVISWWNIAPRLGFTYDVTGEGRSVVKGYWGRYYHNMNSGWQSTNPGGNKSVTYTFLDQNMNGLFDGVHELGERLGGSTGAGLGQDFTRPPVGAAVDPNTTQPYVDEVSGSFEQQIGNDLGFRASLVHKRQTGAFLEPVNIARAGRLTNQKQVPCPASCPDGLAGTMLTVYDLPDGAPTSENLITNVPEGEADFNWTTISLGVNKRFRNNFFWNAYFDYQWRNEGRTPGQSTSPLTTDPVGVGWTYQYGFIPLIQSVSNWQFKGAGRYVMPYDVGVAGTLRLVSGFPWAPLLSVGIGNVGTQTIFLDNLGNRTSDNVSIVDLRVDKGFQLGDSAEIEFMFDIFNALNNASETNFIMRAGSRYRNTIEWIQGRTVGLSARLTF
ncbi:MAG: TonB-dependent receptor [Acidobacteria bacterium]|nr:carboxypeptidase regulatory-like domain-containing protein [Acidobacteriota bacterium]MYB32049.1 TonB-dependent receptor [Acidobacteriota bacterium]MYH21217.1 TonB-dependent receptor [Acidobacteriota bacterium]